MKHTPKTNSPSNSPSPISEPSATDLEAWWFQHRPAQPVHPGEEPWLAAVKRISELENSVKAPNRRFRGSYRLAMGSAAAAAVVIMGFSWPQRVSPRAEALKIQVLKIPTATHPLASEVGTEVLPELSLASAFPILSAVEEIPDELVGYTRRGPFVPVEEPVAPVMTAYRPATTVAEGTTTFADVSVPKSLVVPEKSLFITATEVVDGPEARYPGKFSFGYLIERMAIRAQKSPEEFLKQWLASWSRERRINGLVTKARPAVTEQLLKAWREKDGAAADCWHPDIANAPFRLCAIVNRLDLGALQLMDKPQKPNAFLDKARSSIEAGLDLEASDAEYLEERPLLPSIYYAHRERITPGSAGFVSTGTTGECRFIFCAVDAVGTPFSGGLNVILEYPMGSATPDGLAENISQKAIRWRALSDFPAFDADYTKALVALTSDITELALKKSKDSVVISGSERVNLLRIRTNDGAFGKDREFREFTVNGLGIHLSLPSQSPQVLPGSDNAVYLAKFLGQQPTASISHTAPLTMAKSPSAKPQFIHLSGGSCEIPDAQPDFRWTFPNSSVQPRVRRNFSLFTCNGCHAGETGTQSGMHVQPRLAGQPSKVSRFVAGKIVVSEPALRGISYTMTEMDDRAKILAAITEQNPNRANRRLLAVLEERRWRVH